MIEIVLRVPDSGATPNLRAWAAEVMAMAPAPVTTASIYISQSGRDDDRRNIDINHLPVTRVEVRETTAAPDDLIASGVAEPNAANAEAPDINFPVTVTDLSETFCYLRGHRHREKATCPSSDREADQIATCLAARNSFRTRR